MLECAHHRSTPPPARSRAPPTHRPPCRPPAVDGRIIVYSFKGEPIQRERAGGRDPNGGEASRSSSGPLYCMAWDSRRQNLVVGGNGQLLIYSAVADAHAAIGSSASANVLKLHSVLRAHCTTQGSVVKEEPVRGIIATDSGKLYTVGYDRTFCIWDTDHQSKISLAGEATRGKKKGGEGLREATLKRSWPPEKDQGRPCHDGAISCATFDPDNNWLITGSFDRTVKIWAGDGKKPIAEISNFSDTITGLVYVPATKTLWISFNSPHPLVYDPRSATDITQYLQQSSASAKQLKEAKASAASSPYPRPWPDPNPSRCPREPLRCPCAGAHPAPLSHRRNGRGRRVHQLAPAADLAVQPALGIRNPARAHRLGRGARVLLQAGRRLGWRARRQGGRGRDDAPVRRRRLPRAKVARPLARPAARSPA